MKLFFAGLTDVGILRTVNQDSFFVDPEGRFFIVADGMGGHAGGEEASRIATDSVKAYLIEHWSSDKTSPVLLQRAILKANEDILQDQRSAPQRSDMGTTLVVVIFRDEQEPWCAHIGDSRLYRLRGSKLEQVTEDHTWVARAIRYGEISPEEARVHPWRHVLAQCLGRDDLDEIDIQPLQVQMGDRLLLCSDGLTEELSDQMIAFQLKSIRACDKAASALVEGAKKRGGRDNITVVIVATEAAS
jgi:PPM family protein phosphatase